MARKNSTMNAAPAVLLAITFGFPSTASASPIAPGFDLFISNDQFGNSLGAAVDLSSFWLGIDTIVERKRGIDRFDTSDGLRTVDIELVALHLVSIDPIDLAPASMPGVFADLHTTINKGGIARGLPQPDVFPPSIGRMELRHEDSSGGTFNSAFADLLDPVDPAVQRLAGRRRERMGRRHRHPSRWRSSQPCLRALLAARAASCALVNRFDMGTPAGPGDRFPGDLYRSQLSVPRMPPGRTGDPAEPASLALLIVGGFFVMRRRHRTS